MPNDLDYKNDIEVVGVGMNGEELKRNPVLSSYHVVDLNAGTGPVSEIDTSTTSSTRAKKANKAKSKDVLNMLESDSFDLVLNSVSISS